MFSELRKLLRENVREYGMYIALVVIITFFTIVTGGSFILQDDATVSVSQSASFASCRQTVRGARSTFSPSRARS